MKKTKQWFKGLSKWGKAGVVSAVAIVGLSAIGASAEPSQPAAQVQATPATQHVEEKTEQTKKPKHVPVVTTKIKKTTETIHFNTKTVSDSSLDQGVTETRRDGSDGVLTHRFKVTYTDGKETSRTQLSDQVTKDATSKIIAKGTRAPEPDCPNGTYVNSVGASVCRPYESPSAPAGATAQCVDGSYSFSQSSRGTCSHHGGVSSWL